MPLMVMMVLMVSMIATTTVAESRAIAYACTRRSTNSDADRS